MKYLEACEKQSWHLKIWKRAGGDPCPIHIPYRCKSWRHSGDCRLYCGACDFRRISEGMSKLSNWSCLVLTYPARDWDRKRLHLLFRFGVVSWCRLRKRLMKHVGPIPYVQTWEIHKSQYPHCNVAISNAALWRSAGEDHRTKDGFKRSWLEPSVVASGFGPVCSLKRVYDRDGMAGYLTKLAQELTGAAGKSQVPVNAPRHFRRIRASRGLLPPRLKSEEYTGELVRVPLPE